MVWKPSQRSGNGRGTLPGVRKWSVDPPLVPEVVKGHSRRSGIGLETLPEVRKWSGDPPQGPEVVRGTLP